VLRRRDELVSRFQFVADLTWTLVIARAARFERDGQRLAGNHAVLTAVGHC
jgi:hypothetical protein